MGQCPFSGYFSVTFTTLRLLLNYFSFFSLALTTPQSQTPGHHRNLQGWGFNAVVEGLPSMFNALDWIHSTPLNTHTHTHTHTHSKKRNMQWMVWCPQCWKTRRRPQEPEAAVIKHHTALFGKEKFSPFLLLPTTEALYTEPLMFLPLSQDDFLHCT
jgi:hypothetical protein